MIICTWNLEGLTDIKLFEVCTYMKTHSIDILCIQETRKPKSDHYRTDDGFQVYLSGVGDGSRERAGVGFIVSPKFCRFVMGCRPLSSRISSLKVRVPGGCCQIFSVLAPHNLKPQPERVQFYDELEESISRMSSNGPKLIFGDLNARIGQRRPGEERVLGEHCFGREAVHQVELPNRNLLMEFCSNWDYTVANTLVPNASHNQVTYYEPIARPMEPITIGRFNVLDLLLMPSDDADRLISIVSDRSAAIASHHFPVVSVLQVQLQRTDAQTSVRRIVDLEALQNDRVREQLVRDFKRTMATRTNTSIDSRWQSMCDAMRIAMSDNLPKLQLPKKRPWISERTLALVAQKCGARSTNRWELEKELKGQIRKSVRRDRAAWLEDLASTGGWKQLRLLKKPRHTTQTRLRDDGGITVDTDMRAETFAEHLEKVQWYVRPVSLIPGTDEKLHELDRLNCGAFTYSEMRVGIRKLKCRKATKNGDIPAECLKALAAVDGSALQPLLDLCNDCLTSNSFPAEWQTARVAMIFKKGDPASCENYRPICVLSIAYKLLSIMLKERLLDAGVDKLLWPSQYGFRRKCSTSDAIFVARRRIELAVAQKYGRVSLLALDWSKAFDSVNLSSLLDALRRFGISDVFVEWVGALMRGRQFYVSDNGTQSSTRPQRSGISQGCTLSPLLFIIVMTVLMRDATDMLSPAAREAYAKGDLADIAYADDTLLVAVSQANLEEYLQAVSDAGTRYGLELHYGKLQLLNVRCLTQLRRPDGNALLPAHEMVYLGTVLSEDGCIDAELSRRIGMTKGEFRALCKVWNHSCLSRKRKLHLFESLVQSKLVYSLSSCCLNIAQSRRVNGFQAKCVRRILGIQPSFESRVSNKEVMDRAGIYDISCVLTQQQLEQLGRVLRADTAAPLHTAAFTPGTLEPATCHWVRRVGRPRKEWVPTVLEKARRRKSEDLYALARNEQTWTKRVVNCE